MFAYHGQDTAWSPGTIPLFLGADAKAAAELNLWIEQRLGSASLTHAGKTWRLAAPAIRGMQLDASRSLVPSEPSAYWPLQTLVEYYYLPHAQHFAAVDCGQTPSAWPLSDDPCFTLSLRFQGRLPVSDIDHAFLLHCVPAINLVQRTCDAIPFCANQHRYPLDLPSAESLFSLLTITSTDEPRDTERGIPTQFVPIRDFEHKNTCSSDSTKRIFYALDIAKNILGREQYWVKFYTSQGRRLPPTQHSLFSATTLPLLTVNRRSRAERRRLSAPTRPVT